MRLARDSYRLLTTVAAARNGYATVHPCTKRPTASSINFTPTTATANELITKLSPRGTICIYTNQPVHIALDVVGHTNP